MQFSAVEIRFIVTFYFYKWFKKHCFFFRKKFRVTDYAALSICFAFNVFITRRRGYKFFCHAQLNWARNLSCSCMQMLKMSTIVGILTFISMLNAISQHQNATSERLKARKVDSFQQFSCYEQLTFHAKLSWARKKFYNLGACTLTKHNVGIRLAFF